MLLALTYLEGLVKRITTFLRGKYSDKQIYQLVNFKWNTMVLDNFAKILKKGRSYKNEEKEKEKNVDQTKIPKK